MSIDVKSPLCEGEVAKVRSVATAALVDAYRKQFDIDVSGYLPKQDTIDLHRCEKTGLEFFEPLRELSGPPEFYAALYSSAGASWGYQESKWEFQTAAQILAGAHSVLDVGCGSGHFLESLKGRVEDLSGLETSEYGRKAALEKGLSVFNESIETHANAHAEKYDAVTAFQVLEHTSAPASFIEGCLKAIKSGGALVLSVPNNDAFLRHCDPLPLNMPPHHVTRWNRRSLESIAALYPVSLTRIEAEPLQANNVDWYASVMLDRYLPKTKIVRSVFYRLGGEKIVRRYVLENRETILGHTILASFIKT